jgi:putative phage-type endonuclease
MIAEPTPLPDQPERRGLGGSDAAAAIGLSPWKAPITLWQEKIGQLVEWEGNEPAYWGTVLEPVIREHYARLHDARIYVPPEPLYDVERPWMRASPDGIVLVGEEWDRGLEVKAPGLRQDEHWGAEGSEDVPIVYEVQVRWYMHVTKRPRWDFAVLIGGQGYREYAIERDLEVEEAIVGEADHFWNAYVVPRVPPPPDATSEYSEYLARSYAKKRKDYLVATVELDAKVTQLVELREQLKAVERDKKLLENQVRAAIGDAAGVDTSLGRLKNTLVKGQRKTNWQAIAEELLLQLPLAGVAVERDDLIAKHTKRGSSYHRFYLGKKR